jgi:thiamine-phosphate diphosphorylase
VLGASPGDRKDCACGKPACRKMTKPTFADYRLYFVTDPILHKGRPVLEQVRLALRGGVRILQIREKERSVPDCIVLVKEALALTRACGAFLIVNDSIEVAASGGADGLHLGQEDMPVREARRILGGAAIIGLSVKTPEEAVRGEEDGADYIAVNGVFPTATKADLGYCPGLDGVAAIRKKTRLPVIGIGGITPDNCRRVIEAGAHGIAVVTALTMSDDMPSACRRLFDRMGTSERETTRRP